MPQKCHIRVIRHATVPCLRTGVVHPDHDIVHCAPRAGTPGDRGMRMRASTTRQPAPGTGRTQHGRRRYDRFRIRPIGVRDRAAVDGNARILTDFLASCRFLRARSSLEPMIAALRHYNSCCMESIRLTHRCSCFEHFTLKRPSTF